MNGNLPPGCTQQMCDEAQPGYWDEPDDPDAMPECDCCGNPAILARCWTSDGLETWACEECRGVGA